MTETATPQVHHATVMDDEARHVARVYAEALFRAAEEAGLLEEVRGELDSLVGEVFRQDPGLELFFASAAVGRERKQAILQNAFGERATPVFAHFLTVLNAHDRLDMLRAVAGAFKTIYERHRRQLEVQVRSAVPLTDEERARLIKDVQELTGFQPLLNETVDPDILGGLVIRVRDWVYDASVRTRLLGIRKQLSERSSHAIQSGRDRFRSDA